MKDMNQNRNNLPTRMTIEEHKKAIDRERATAHLPLHERLPKSYESLQYLLVRMYPCEEAQDC
jgi:hypothetical protein